MAAILHPVQCAVGPNDDPKWIVERRMLGELAICRQSLNTCSRQSGDSAWRWLWLEKRCGDRGRGKPYKLSAVLLSFHMKTQQNRREFIGFAAAAIAAPF